MAPPRPRMILQLGRRAQLSFATLVDDGLRRELRKTVADPNNRRLVYSLLDKANDQSWDLAHALDAEIDPFKTVEHDISQLNRGIAELVANKHPLLSVMARYYFQVPGKRFRPTVVLLMGRATGGEASKAARHIQLAEIVEMIHTASLAHDDVLDEADERRGQLSINAKFGNKFAVLVGDFLLARASVSLAGLKDHTVTGLLSNMIAELVEGEFVQMRPQSLSMDVYLRKTYLKTASMLSNAARAAAVLSDPLNTAAIETASQYGEALGMAFQIVDDVLDITSDSTGKAQNADLAAGIVTAPLLFAAESRPELKTLFGRGFSGEGDRSTALQVLSETDGIAKAMALASSYCSAARLALAGLPPSHSRDVLDHLAQKVLTRKH